MTIFVGIHNIRIIFEEVSKLVSKIEMMVKYRYSAHSHEKMHEMKYNQKRFKKALYTGK